MRKYFDLVLNNQGQPIAGALITVRLAGTQTNATLYQDEGITPLTNPVSTDSLGFYWFYVDNGLYDLVIQALNFATITLTNVLIEDAATTSDLSNSTDVTKGDALVAGKRTDTGAVAFTLHEYHENRWFNVVVDFGADKTGVSDSTTEIQAAVDAAEAAGGGVVYFPSGTYLLSNGNPGASSWDNEVAIWVLANNVHLLGDGIGATTLKLAASGNAHVVKFGQRTGGTVAVNNCSVSHMTIDGNRANQGTPNDTDDHWQGVDVASNCTKIRISDVYIHDTPYYGIGMQRDGISDSIIENVVIENTGADGIDWKNDTGSGTGNFVRNIVVRNFGILSALTYAQAGCEFRSGVTAENIIIEDMTGAADLVGVRTLGDGDSTSFAIPFQPTTLSGITVNGNSGVGSVGIRITTLSTKLSDAYVRDCDYGVSISRIDSQVSNVTAESNNIGFRLYQDPTIALEADTVQLIGIIARDNVTAGIVYDSVDEVTVIAADVRGNGIGHDIKSGSTNVRIIGGSLNGNSTAVSDSGTSTIIKDVVGFKTRSVVSGSAAIDATGVKSLTIAHGLAVTPNVNDVSLTLKRNTNVSDWAPGALWTVATDATNISCQLNVLTASATGGAVVDVVATINSKATA